VDKGEDVLFGLPRGDDQKELAESIAAKLKQLRMEGDLPYFKQQATRRKIMKAIELLPKCWKPKTPFTLLFDKIVEVKQWIWLLEKLDLNVYSIKHHPARGLRLKPEEQRHYWAELLGCKSGKIIEKHREGQIVVAHDKAKYGLLEFRVPASAVVGGSKDKSGQVLTAARLALVAEWIDGWVHGLAKNV